LWWLWLPAIGQTKLMGGVGQRMLFTLRNAIFNKLQLLPVDFFNQNKAGDLISRVNNDTDKLNQFFSQSLVQFIGSIATMTGAGIFLLADPCSVRIGCHSADVFNTGIYNHCIAVG
jgi:ABC-type multidrug transport system fused ATPase/permease subunit